MTISSYTLYRICNEKQYFTDGSNEQYDKLFELNRQNISIIELATIIWICSDGKKRTDIFNELLKAQLEDKKYNRI